MSIDWFSNEVLNPPRLSLGRGSKEVRQFERSESGVPALAFHEVRSGGVHGADDRCRSAQRSHTAVAIDGDEVELASVTVRATRRQVDELLGWSARFEDRTWAIESADGLGYLLGQQLVAAGERALDVPATLAARVRDQRLDRRLRRVELGHPAAPFAGRMWCGCGAATTARAVLVVFAAPTRTYASGR